MTTAIERFKAYVANAIERICVLEEQLELAHERIAELEAEAEKTSDPDSD